MPIRKLDVVEVIKSTRAKVKEGFFKARKGEKYLVLSSYTSSYTHGFNTSSTTKLFLCDLEGQNKFITTNTCVNSLFNLGDHVAKFETDYEKWYKAKKLWMDKEYIPAIVFNHYDYRGFPVTLSNQEDAALVSPLRDCDRKVWIGLDHVHDDDIKLLTSSSLPPVSSSELSKKDNSRSSTVTVRIPMWLAKKQKFFGSS
jgi:hypothetical protein